MLRTLARHDKTVAMRRTEPDPFLEHLKTFRRQFFGVGQILLQVGIFTFATYYLGRITWSLLGSDRSFTQSGLVQQRALDDANKSITQLRETVKSVSDQQTVIKKTLDGMQGHSGNFTALNPTDRQALLQAMQGQKDMTER